MTIRLNYGTINHVSRGKGREMLKVGEFTCENGSVAGPAEYMRERGSARLERIMSGTDTVFNFGCRQSPNVETAVLVSLQTDYAAWKGQRLLLAGRR